MTDTNDCGIQGTHCPCPDCEIQGTHCPCHDCEIYFNPETERPVKGNGITDKVFDEIIEICNRESVIDIMKAERYKALIYQIIPYPFWKQLEDPVKYNSILNKLKESNEVPNENPEICSVGLAKQIDIDGVEREITVVSYRFPTSTVKYELIIYDDNNKLKLRTHSRGAEESLLDNSDDSEDSPPNL